MLLAMEAKLSLTLKSLLRPKSSEDGKAVDAVTQLPTLRQMFLEVEEKLSISRRIADGFGVVICSLNEFEEVSDLHGTRWARLC